MALHALQTDTPSEPLDRRPTSRFEVLDLFRELFLEGGIAITTKLAPADANPVIRSIIQPDGDVVLFVREDALANPPLLSIALAAHFDSIHARIGVIPRAAARVRRIARFSGLAAGALGALFARGNLRYVLAIALPIAFFIVGQIDKAIVRLAVRWVLRRARTALLQ